MQTHTDNASCCKQEHSFANWQTAVVHSTHQCARLTANELTNTCSRTHMHHSFNSAYLIAYGQWFAGGQHTITLPLLFLAVAGKVVKELLALALVFDCVFGVNLHLCNLHFKICHTRHLELNDFLGISANHPTNSEPILKSSLPQWHNCTQTYIPTMKKNYNT